MTPAASFLELSSHSVPACMGMSSGYGKPLPCTLLQMVICRTIGQCFDIAIELFYLSECDGSVSTLSALLHSLSTETRSRITPHIICAPRTMHRSSPFDAPTIFKVRAESLQASKKAFTSVMVLRGCTKMILRIHTACRSLVSSSSALYTSIELK